MHNSEPFNMQARLLNDLITTASKDQHLLTDTKVEVIQIPFQVLALGVWVSRQRKGLTLKHGQSQNLTHCPRFFKEKIQC